MRSKGRSFLGGYNAGYERANLAKCEGPLWSLSLLPFLAQPHSQFVVTLPLGCHSSSRFAEVGAVVSDRCLMISTISSITATGDPHLLSPHFRRLSTPDNARSAAA
jgi:hypothetical protein